MSDMQLRTGDEPHVPLALCGLGGFVIVAGGSLGFLEIANPALRAALGGPLLLLAPGYALVAVLFPRTDSPALTDGRPLAALERLALAFGLSVAILPLVGLVVLSITSATTTTVVGAVSGLTLALTVVATVRWYACTPADRPRLRVGNRGTSGKPATGRSRANTAASLLLAGAVLIAVSSVGYALTAPQDGETDTSLHLLTEEDDELVAANVSSTLEPDDALTLTLALENQEGDSQNYTAVIQEQWVDDDGTVRERTDLDEHTYDLADGETLTDDLEVAPETDSGTVRIAVLLYEESVPETPTTDDAYRYGTVWTEIDDPIEDDG